MVVFDADMICALRVLAGMAAPCCQGCCAGERGRAAGRECKCSSCSWLTGRQAGWQAGRQLKC